MDNFNVNFGDQEPKQQKQKFDDFSDLDPIVVNKSQIKNFKKPVSNEISFGVVTADRFVLVAGCLIVLAMFLPWAKMSYEINLFGYQAKDSMTLSQFKDNTFEAVFAFIAAGVSFLAAIRHHKRYIISSMIFFAASAVFIIRKQIKVRQTFAQYDFFNVSYQVGFYVYLVAAILMVFAMVLTLLDKS